MASRMRRYDGAVIASPFGFILSITAASASSLVELSLSPSTTHQSETNYRLPQGSPDMHCTELK